MIKQNRQRGFVNGVGAWLFADRQLNFLLVTNVAVLAVATLLAGTDFIGLYNLQSMAAQVPELGLLALGVMLAMISGNGGIDLSGIALANLSGMIAGLLAGWMLSPDEAPLAYTLLFLGIAVAVGLLGGMLNGVLIAWAGLTPILATLGTQLLFTGAAVVLTNGSALRLGYVEPLDDFGNATIFGIPLCFALFIAIAGLITFVLRYTPFGVHLYLLGTNAKAARYAGIACRRVIFLTYTVCGVLASVAGAIIAARTSSVKWDYGSSYVMIAILIVVAAGVRPAGGYGRLICVVLSATALQLLSSMFNFLNLSNFFRDCAWGLMLLLFLAVSRFDVKAWWQTQFAAR
ncbi:MAG: ABC transporter permease [Zoogloeaceae bacterium]|jgi:simple sugar transport system permease protein|nr:ABC transporter permease [Zoogloeaceae bacterium]